MLNCLDVTDEMDCEPLFAESDDDVEVLPVPIEEVMSQIRGPIPKSGMSNYVNSTSPIQPLSHPVSAYTPVPEEYQPLPDSSSSIDYVLGRGNSDNTISNNPGYSDINMRYQPKPANQNGYFYSNYPPSHYASVRSTSQYVVSPYSTNNRIVVGDDRNYLPINYTLAANQAPVPDNISHMGYEQRQPNINDPVTRYSGNGSQSQANSLERPSRQLNISPGRKLSKESEANPNLIEVSSEEEENPSTTSRPQHPSTTNSNVNLTRAHSNGNRSVDSSSNAFIDVKREPQQQPSTLPNNVRQNATQSLHTNRPNQVNYIQAHTHNRSPYVHQHIIKQENIPNHNNAHVNNQRVCIHHVENTRAHRSNPNYHNNGSHNQTPHICRISQDSQNPTIVNIKQEYRQPVVKTENVERDNSSNSELNTGIVKVESLESVTVKTEPVSSPHNSVTSDSNNTTQVKIEKIEFQEPRRPKESSPQPGTSSGRNVSQSESSATSQGTSTEQVSSTLCYLYDTMIF